MTSSELGARVAAVEAVYDGIVRRAAESSQNFVPPLAVALDGPDRLRFLPAVSLAIQSLVPPSHQRALTALAALLRGRFPWMAARTFWQEEGTLHINAAILRRLSTAPLSDVEVNRLAGAAACAMQWLDGQPSYEIASLRVLMAADGTLMAVGIPTSLAPWSIREAFAAAGFPDQQVLFHVTIARILEVLPAPQWRGVVDFTSSVLAAQPISPLRVRDAMLVNEREGYLHSPACYDVLRRFTFT